MTDLTRLTWRKSSRSGANNGQCVELARTGGTGFGVRDSKNPEGPTLMLPGRLDALLEAVKAGRLG